MVCEVGEPTRSSSGSPFMVDHGVDFEVHVLVVHVAGSSHGAFVVESESFGDAA